MALPQLVAIPTPVLLAMPVLLSVCKTAAEVTELKAIIKRLDKGYLITELEYKWVASLSQRWRLENPKSLPTERGKLAI